MDRKKIVIIGAGPAGLSLAYALLCKKGYDFDVTILEKEASPGGLASGFEHRGLQFDFGSHRLHPSTSAHLLNDIQNILGSDLLDRPRYGRIRLLEKYVMFPLKLQNFMFRLPSSFFTGILFDMLSKPFRKKTESPKSFAEALMAGLGKTICNHFYFPYAEKLWGLKPDQISAIQAERRVSANNMGKIIAKVLAIIPIFRKKGTGRFFYPRKGFLQIFEGIAQKIREKGGRLEFSHPVTAIDPGSKKITTDDGQSYDYDIAFTTMPIPDFLNALRTNKPKAVTAANHGICYRGMVFCYLILKTNQFTPYDAHYFPESGLVFSRLSEPKNYSASKTPENMTGLCLEIPCAAGGTLWNESAENIVHRVTGDMRKAGLPIDGLVDEYFLKRTAYAYPTYDLDFEDRINTVEAFLKTIPDIIPFGRQALFVHDNTHHTMEMGYAAAECLSPDGTWDRGKWEVFRESFRKHVVED